MPDAPASRRRFHPRLWLAALAIVYVTGAVATALSERPWCDEGWFAEPAWNLVRLGEMSTPTLDTSLEPALNSLKRHTSWVFPTYLVTLGGWSWVFGFTLFAARMYSTLWGAVLLGAVVAILRKFGVAWRWVFLALALLIVDYQFLRRASEVRMDIMCAALGFAAIAFYLNRRERNQLQAMVGSHALCAVGVLTHPMGVLAYTSLLFTQFYFDRKKIRFTSLALCAVPYLVGMAIWSLYILQAPDDFLAQFAENAAGRGGFWANPLAGILHELHERYIVHLGGLAAGVEWFKALKAIGLATVSAALLTLLAAPRSADEPAGLARYLGFVTAIHAAGLTVLDGMKLHFYLIHVAPGLYLLTALAVARLWSLGGWVRPATALWMAAHFVIQAGGAAYPIYRYSMGDYLAATRFVEEHSRGGDLVMGSAELGFELGFAGALLDDWTLGCLNGLEPTIIVQENGYRQRQTQWKTKCNDHVARVLAPEGDYRIAMEQGEYRIYLRRDADSDAAVRSR